jgi:hypothetical protein
MLLFSCSTVNREKGRIEGREVVGWKVLAKGTACMIAGGGI